ncbi:Nucleotide-binding alpha-beta plait [Penicillium brevicompactum]|uniref:Nucleotide-binding alpha-beta plait n=1 Tax=Penicillium brevicompactum TaxID=5074 RepID=A0A9W9QQJ0_PENBR|nr:Nucleotide-binding alpha-beta plait [Penicillium brevicompactum]
MAWPIDEDAPPDEESLAVLQTLGIEGTLQASSRTIGDVTSIHSPCRAGVLMITNIPFTVTRQEVNSFLGRGNQPIGDRDGPHIHVIMERSTGKTMDCFVEYVSDADAEKACARLNRNYDLGSAPRMGNRHVDVEMSSPEQLMKALFPLTKCVEWNDGSPVEEENNDHWSTGFDGFLTDEELFCLVRHAEQPHRSAFASKIPQRCYESFISTLWKFPWHATHMYTVYQRNKLFHTLVTMIRILVERMQRQNTVGLDYRLLCELTGAGIACPAFNPRMKFCIAFTSEDQAIINTLSKDWCIYFPFDTLSYATGCSAMDLQFFAYLMSKGIFPTPRSTDHKNIPTHVKRPLFGPNFFEWSDNASPKILYKDSVAHESRMFRHFIITGWQRLNQREASISTIGGPPQSSHAGDNESLDNESVDSDRTVMTRVHKPKTPAPPPAAPAYRKTGPPYRRARVPHARDNSESFSRNWTFPNRQADEPMPANPGPIEQETPTRRPKGDRARPYRPPQLRNSLTERDPFVEAGPSEDRSHRKTFSLESLAPPTYYMPHATAHNVRSSSYSYPAPQGSTLAPDPQHNRAQSELFREARSEMYREINQIESSVFDIMRESYADELQRKESNKREKH